MITKEAVFTKVDYKSIAWFIGLMGIAIILPRFIHNQFVAGPIVNATLFLGAYYLGAGQAILVGLVPSVVALSAGLLPLPLAPMVPFIMISNAILILTFNKFRDWNFGAASILASLAKYAFLYLMAILVINTLMPTNLAVKAVAAMMAWPQLVTALIGAMIAFGLIKDSTIEKGGDMSSVDIKKNNPELTLDDLIQQIRDLADENRRAAERWDQRDKENFFNGGKNDSR